MTENTWFDDVMQQEKQEPAPQEETVAPEAACQPEETSPAPKKKKKLILLLAAGAAMLALLAVCLFCIPGGPTEGVDLFHCGLVAVRSDGLWGYMDTDGQWAVEPQFDDVENFAENGLAIAGVGGLFGAINTDGEWVIQPQCRWMESFQSNGLARAQLAGGKVGALDADGQWVIPPVYRGIGEFSENGLAMFREINRKCGYINTDGQIVIPAQFENAEDFAEDGYAMVQLGGGWGFIDESGTFVDLAGDVEIGKSSEEDLLKVKKDNGKYGYINAAGEWVIQPQFEYAEPFGKNGLAVAGVADGENSFKRGFIDAQGQWVLPPEHDIVKANTPHVGIFLVWDGDSILDINDGRWQLLDEDGESIFDLSDGYLVYPMDDGVFVSQDGYIKILRDDEKQGDYKVGIIDTDGNIIIEPNYDSIDTYVHGINKGWGQ